MKLSQSIAFKAILLTHWNVKISILQHRCPTFPSTLPSKSMRFSYSVSLSQWQSSTSSAKMKQSASTAMPLVITLINSALSHTMCLQYTRPMPKASALPNAAILRRTSTSSPDKKTPSSPHPSFTEAHLYYHPPTFDTAIISLTGCFALIISTPSQREAAWCYRHQKQVLMDGTFGITLAQVLLFILMVIDNHFHGIPIAYMLVLLLHP
jgi:hypothetical protein